MGTHGVIDGRLSCRLVARGVDIVSVTATGTIAMIRGRGRRPASAATLVIVGAMKLLDRAGASQMGQSAVGQLTGDL